MHHLNSRRSGSNACRASSSAPLEEAALDPFRYIEVVYNRTRICSALGYLGPAEFEKADWPAEDSRPRAA